MSITVSSLVTWVDGIYTEDLLSTIELSHIYKMLHSLWPLQEENRHLISIFKSSYSMMSNLVRSTLDCERDTPTVFLKRWLPLLILFINIQSDWNAKWTTRPLIRKSVRILMFRPASKKDFRSELIIFYWGLNTPFTSEDALNLIRGLDFRKTLWQADAL